MRNGKSRAKRRRHPANREASSFAEESAAIHGWLHNTSTNISDSSHHNSTESTSLPNVRTVMTTNDSPTTGIEDEEKSRNCQGVISVSGDSQQATTPSTTSDERSSDPIILTHVQQQNLSQDTNSLDNGNRSVSKSSAKKGKVKKILVGQSIWDRLLLEAEYEIEQDPFRGLLRLFQPPTTAATAVPQESATKNPWKKCSFATRRFTPTHRRDGEEMDDDDPGAIAVKQVCQSSCPSLIAWTNEAQSKALKTRKRKRKPLLSSTTTTDSCLPFGQRPPDDANRVRCRCDYNPFCLGTLGGLMDKVLMKRYEKLQVKEQQQHKIIECIQQTDSEHNDITVIDSDMDDKSVVMVTPTSNTSPVVQTTVKDLCPITVESVQSTETAKKMAKVRKSMWIDESAIRSYLANTLQGLTSVVCVDSAMETLRKRHEGLVFNNTLDGVEEQQQNRNRIQVSIPPGIENLGATCYLNTQLQCLAQNLVFVDGILSWKAEKKDDRMGSVITLFQQLLARMRLGPLGTLDTLGFSNALGLDHFEQQDPNEFSRLFFERIHDFFQRGSNGKANKEHDLSKLLPHLFQGSMVYETTCLTCESKSRMKEEFMDLNLPIVRPTIDVDSKPQGTIDMIWKQKAQDERDTDVQYCLNSYCSSEKLNGDNQYLCIKCGCKRDAERDLKFDKIPPLLNVQLSRYVFDRRTLMKKKLGEKVLLPRELEVLAKGGKESAEVTTHRYILCAVMRHQGKSAYSGHYVAEAMDWITGQWYEFNDEKVTYLKGGPTCSYASEKCGSGKPVEEAKKVKHPKGSEDAYNMYYVEESFLAQCMIDNLRGGSKETNDSVEEVNAVEAAVIERSTYYCELSQLCLDDASAAKRLSARESKLKDNVISKLIDDAPTTLVETYWIDSVILRKYFDTKDRAEKELIDPSILFTRRPELCPHGKIHPRQARKGKVLPTPLVDALFETISEERKALLVKDEPGAPRLYPPPAHFCETCGEEYRLSLASKVDLCKKLKHLNEALHPSEDTGSSSGKFLPEGDAGPGHYVYAVSSKFANTVRRQITKVVKCAASANETTSNNLSLSLDSESLSEGIDALDLSSFGFFTESVDEGVISEMDQFDRSVNGHITCDHGRLKYAQQRSVRFVGDSIWAIILDFFPQAIEHKLLLSGQMTAPECPDCQDEQDSKRWLFDLARHCNTGGRNCKTITQNELVADKSADESGTEYRVVHKADIDVWKNCIRMLHKKKEKREENINEQVLKMLFKGALNRPASDPVSNVAIASNQQRQARVLSLLSRFFCPLVCTDHGKAVESALLKQESLDSKTPRRLKDELCFLVQSEYDDLIVHLTAVALMVSAVEVDLASSQSSGKEYTDFIDEARQMCQLPEFKFLLPTVKALAIGTKSESEFVVSSWAISKLFCVCQKMCNNQNCGQCATDWEKMRVKDGWLDDSSSSVTKNVATFTNQTMTGTAPEDAIALWSDCEETKAVLNPGKFLKVFEVTKDSSPDKIISSLSSCMGLATEESDGFGSLRRSSRRRKTRYPLGEILSEQSLLVQMNKNVAALRLLLMERCTEGSSFEPNHVVKVALLPPQNQQCNEQVSATGDVVNTETASLTPTVSSVIKLKDLTHDQNGAELQEALKDLLASLSTVDGGSRNIEEHLIIVRQGRADDSTCNFSKEELMDHLICLANNDPDDSVGGAKVNARKRKTRIEKGFSGTFLSSFSTVPENHSDTTVAQDNKRFENGDDVNDDGQAVVEVSNLKKQKKSPSATDTPATSLASATTIPLNAPFTIESKLHSPIPNKRKEPTVAAQQPPLEVVEDSDDDDAVIFSGGLSLTKAKNSGESSPLKRTNDTSVSPCGPRNNGNAPTTPEDNSDSLALSLTNHHAQANGMNGSSGRRSSRPPPTIAVADKDELTGDLVSRLLKTLGEIGMSVDESACLAAATWAVTTYPHELQVDSLIDRATTKYLDDPGQ